MKEEIFDLEHWAFLSEIKAKCIFALCAIRPYDTNEIKASSLNNGDTKVIAWS